MLTMRAAGAFLRDRVADRRVFRTIRDRNGTPVVALDRDELAADGVLTDEGEIPDGQEAHIQRLTDGAYIVQIPGDGLRDLDELVPGL
jgi:hypothetical protein